jgi:hypothetical protein
VALSEPGKQYAIYLHRPPKEPADTDCKIALDLPAGTYAAEWLSPETGKAVPSLRVEHAGGRCLLSVPSFREDMALRLVSAARE